MTLYYRWQNVIFPALTFLLGSLIPSGVNGHSHPSSVITTTSHNASFHPKTHGSAHRRRFSHEHCLMQQLMINYDRSVRPVHHPHDAVNVTLGLTLKKILDLDEKNQILTTMIWLEASWYDSQLIWTSARFGGIVSVLIPPHKIWLPDIVLYNSVDDYTSGYMPSLAMVYNDSRVFWGPVVRFRSACKIDITYFPFDNQICKMKMGSWAYNGLQVDIWNSSQELDLSTYVDNGEWELLAVVQRRNVVFYACCKEPYPDVTFTIILRRRTVYYFMNILIPCILLSFLCLGGFLLPSDSGEKITLGLSVLLTITVFMLMVADRMPHTSESISVISIYLMAVLSTSCISVLSSVLVLSIHHQRRPRKVPACFRWMCYGTCGRMFRLGTIDKPNSDNGGSSTTISQNGDTSIEESPAESKPANDDTRIRQILSKYNRDSDTRSINDNHIGCGYYDDDLEYTGFEPRNIINHTNNDGFRHSPSYLGNFEIHHNYTASTSTCFDSQQKIMGKDSNVLKTSGDGLSFRERDLRSSLITQMATMLVEKENNETKNEIFQEWHNLAYVLDRSMFIFFLVLTIVSTALLGQCWFAGAFLPAACEYTTKCPDITEPQGKTAAYCEAVVKQIDCLVTWGIRPTGCLFDLKNIRIKVSEVALDAVTYECGGSSLVPSVLLPAISLVTLLAIRS